MPSEHFSRMLNNYRVILGEGAVIERLRRDTEFELDPHIANSAFIYETQGRTALEEIYRQYMDIGYKHDLPLLLSTPTWRASLQRIADAGWQNQDVNGDNYAFLDELRRSYDAYEKKIIISGLMSCQGDAYQPSEALSKNDARSFHAWQAEKLAETGVDCLLAATLPALSEAIGMAMAMAETGKPYLISFIYRPQGQLLDGTPLDDAVNTIDDLVSPQPQAYLANCTHPTAFESALNQKFDPASKTRERIAGLLANTASLDPMELDNSDTLVTEEPDVFGSSMAHLYHTFGIKILGGCCGTDQRHIQAIAEHISA